MKLRKHIKQTSNLGVWLSIILCFFQIVFPFHVAKAEFPIAQIIKAIFKSTPEVVEAAAKSTPEVIEAAARSKTPIRRLIDGAIEYNIDPKDILNKEELSRCLSQQRALELDKGSLQKRMSQLEIMNAELKQSELKIQQLETSGNTYSQSASGDYESQIITHNQEVATYNKDLNNYNINQKSYSTTVQFFENFCAKKSYYDEDYRTITSSK